MTQKINIQIYQISLLTKSNWFHNEFSFMKYIRVVFGLGWGGQNLERHKVEFQRFSPKVQKLVKVQNCNSVYELIVWIQNLTLKDAIFCQISQNLLTEFQLILIKIAISTHKNAVSRFREFWGNKNIQCRRTHYSE